MTGSSVLKFIICVGAASKKGTDHDWQEDLAGLRALELASWIRKYPDLRGQLYTLTVGQFSAKQRDTAFQRPIVLIRSIENVPPGLNLEQAINNGLKLKAKEDGTVRSLIGDYSLNKDGKIGIFR